MATKSPVDRSLDPNAFTVHRATVGQDAVELAFIREGVGGVPLLLFYGWPGTKRIFYRNIGPLAEAGFEVVAPDVSGWGDSPVNPNRYADAPRTARDFKALMEYLGHSRWVTAGFDFGSVSAMDMVNRFPDQVIRQVLWNALVPILPDAYAKAGIPGDTVQDTLDVSDHILDHGTDPDGFAAQLDTPERRREYVTGYYQARVYKAGGPVRRLAAEGSFDEAAAAFHSQPYGDAAVFRSTLNFYEALLKPEVCSETPLLEQTTEVETMFLYGVEDEIVSANITLRAEVAYPNLVGPFCVNGGGHFLSWERPQVVNGAITSFCRDLLVLNGRDT